MNYRAFETVAFVICVLLAVGCNTDDAETPVAVESPAPAVAPPDDPLSILPEDISLWEAFDPKRILKQPETNTLVVEGVIEGDAAVLAGELEAASVASGWTTGTLMTNGGLTTLILEKESRRLKVNLTQEGVNSNVYMTTRLPE
jgi:hypothetical protein